MMELFFPCKHDAQLLIPRQSATTRPTAGVDAVSCQDNGSSDLTGIARGWGSCCVTSLGNKNFGVRWDMLRYVDMEKPRIKAECKGWPLLLCFRTNNVL